jgi:hypothetical protein
MLSEGLGSGNTGIDIFKVSFPQLLVVGRY